MKINMDIYINLLSWWIESKFLLNYSYLNTLFQRKPIAAGRSRHLNEFESETNWMDEIFDTAHESS